MVSIAKSRLKTPSATLLILRRIVTALSHYDKRTYNLEFRPWVEQDMKCIIREIKRSMSHD